MENNDRQSSINMTRQINTRYYFTTDIIIEHEVSVELFPTLDMIDNYVTKSLQESQFFRFRDIIIGVHEDDIPSYNTSRRSLIEERKIKIDRYKEDTHRASRLAGD